VADAEKGGHTVDASSAADVMEALLDQGLHTFDMVRQKMHALVVRQSRCGMHDNKKDRHDNSFP
jgi:hypothetical protein